MLHARGNPPTFLKKFKILDKLIFSLTAITQTFKRHTGRKKKKKKKKKMLIMIKMTSKEGP